jgi:hypothetical protein
MAVEKQRLHDEADERDRQAAIPVGYRYMTSEEKECSSLDLQGSRREVLDELKRMPLNVTTLSQRRRKIELEVKLSEIERTLEKLAHRNVLISISA